jgi:hypothetical protein
MPEKFSDYQEDLLFSDRNEKVVIIFINGFMVPPAFIPYNRTSQPKDFLIYNVTPSCVGSLHDRACYIFYQIKGGKINYGEEHSEFHGHSQYGEEELNGLYPEWDENHPIILIGHSLGGLTALTLQNYLADEQGKKLGSSYRTSANWIKGIITTGTPWNGALRTYTKGMNLYQIPIISFGSQGYFIGLVVAISEFLNWKCLRKMFANPHWKTTLFSSSFVSFTSSSSDSLAFSLYSELRRCFFCCFVLFLAFCGFGIHTNTDNASFDITVQASKIWNEYLHIFPNTFYFALIGHLTFDKEEEEMLEGVGTVQQEKEENRDNTLKKGIQEELEELMVPKAINGSYLLADEQKEEEEETTTCEYSNSDSMIDDRLLSSPSFSSSLSSRSSSNSSETSLSSAVVVPALLLSSGYSPTFHYLLKFLMKHDYSSDLASIPKTIANLATSSWHDEGNDGLIDVYSQRIPSHLLAKEGKMKEEYEKRIITIPCSSFFSSSKEEKRKRTDKGNGIEFKAGNWYRSVVRNTCHLSILFQCPSTWKLLHRLITIIEENYQKQRRNQPLTSFFQDEEDADKEKSDRNTRKEKENLQRTEFSRLPDQQLPHLEFHYHYHLPHHILYGCPKEKETRQSSNASSVFERILGHMERCRSSHFRSFCFFWFLVLSFLLFFHKPFFSSFCSLSLFTNYCFVLSQFLQLLLCGFFLLLSVTDVDCTEKVILFFNSCRISFLLFLFCRCLYNYDSVSTTLHLFLPSVLAYFIVNNWLESLFLFCFSDSHVSSPYHHNHCPRDNNRYTGMILGKTAFLMLLHITSTLVSGSSLCSSDLSSLPSVMVALLLSYYLLISLAPLSWQWVYHQKGTFQISSSQTTLTPSQLIIALFVIACHLIHLFVLIVFLTQFYSFLSLLSASSAASSSSSSSEFSDFFSSFSFSLPSLAFFFAGVLSFRFLLILLMLSVSSVVLSNYQLLSQNLQFTLLKLQFWRFYLSKQLLPTDRSI